MKNNKKVLLTLLSLLLMLVLLPISITDNEVEAENANNCLTFTATGESSVTFNYKSGDAVKYNIGDTSKADDWQDYTEGTKIDLADGKSVSFICTNVKTNENKHFTMTGSIAASGDVTSLTNGGGGDVALTEKCYQYMFAGCTSLTTAPNLPSTTLADYCYIHMFEGCTSLTVAPELPAGKDGEGSLAQYCYQGMFKNCTSLTTAPDLPSTSLAEGCYASMFADCTSLTTTPELSATTLAPFCYRRMFKSCTSLTTTPKLPATTLASGCYAYMFEGCASLITTPELLAKKLATNCYRDMFRDCTSLTVPADISHVEELADGCCQYMYAGCTGIAIYKNKGNYEWKTPNTTSATGWSSGMFKGTSGGLKVDPDAGKTYYLNSFTDYKLSDNVETIVKQETHTSTIYVDEPAKYIKIYYSIDDGENWTETADGKYNLEVTEETTPQIKKVIFKLIKSGYVPKVTEDRTITVNPKINQDYSDPYFTDLEGVLSFLEGRASGCTIDIQKAYVEGSTTVLIYKDDSTTPIETSNYTVGEGSVAGSTKVNIKADYLNGLGVGIHKFKISFKYSYNEIYSYNVTMTVSTDKYLTFTANEDNSSVTFAYEKADKSMYRTSSDGGTTWSGWEAYKSGTKVSLAKGDKVQFSATNATTSSSSHFTMTGSIAASGDVTSLTNGGGGDVALTEKCYQYMFAGCTSLTTAPNLPSTTLAAHCYNSMFKGCTKLTTAPELPAGKDGKGSLAQYCYKEMFNGCTSLTTAPELPAKNLEDYCYNNMFQDCIYLSKTPGLPATKLVDSCYSGMFQGCVSLTKPADMSHVEELAEFCCTYMYYRCTSISIGNTVTSKPWVATKTKTPADHWSDNMFLESGSSIVVTPNAGTTYYINDLDTIKYSCDDVMVTYDGNPHSFKIDTTPTGATIQYSTDGGLKWNDSFSASEVTPLRTVKIKITANGYKALLFDKQFEIAPTIDQSKSTPTFKGITGTLSFNKGKLSENCVIDINKEYVDGSTTALIYKDGSTTPIDTSNYTVGKGSTKVTLLAGYLNKLDVGTHKFKVDITYKDEGTFSYNLVIKVTTPYIPVETSCK